MTTDILNLDDSPLDSADNADDDRQERIRQAYEMRHNGALINDIAEHFQVDRKTIRRWLREHEALARAEFETVPRATIIARELNKLEADERNARRRAESADSERTRIEYLKLANRAQSDRIALLFKAGILEAAPEKLLQAVADLTPDAARHEQDDAAFDRLSPADKKQFLILRKKMSRTIGGPDESDDGEIGEALSRLRQMQ